jgi:hypothetical protein
MHGVFLKPQKTLQTPHDRCTAYFEASKDTANAARQMHGVFLKLQKTLQTLHDRCTAYF